MDEQTALMDHGAEGDSDSGTGATNAFPPPQPPPRPPWYRIPVARERTDRKVGGVVSGLCRAYGFDLRTTRIAVAVAAIVLPLVFFVYLLAWIVLPDGAEAAVPLEDIVRDRRRLPLLIAMGIFALAVGLGSVGTWLVWGGVPWGLGLIVLGVLLWVAPSLRPTGDTPRWSPPAGSWPAPGDAGTTRPFGPVPAGPYAGPHANSSGVTTTAAGTTLVPPPRPAPAPRRRIPIGAVTVIGVFAFVGVAWLGELLDWWDARVLPVAVASVLALCIGAALSAVVNRIFWPLAIVPPLAVAAVGLLVTSPNLDGGTGDRTVRPTTAVTVVDEQMAMGQLTIDLRQLPSLDGVQVDAEVGYGRIHLLVPDDVVLEVHSAVNAGHVVIDGREVVAGLRQRDDRTIAVPDTTAGSDEVETLRLDLQVGAGEISIDRTGDDPLAGTAVDI
jgi:phage shock protein PspC (stress-responsive transcriptional regulator)